MFRTFGRKGASVGLLVAFGLLAGAERASAGAIYLTGHDVMLHNNQNGYDVVTLDFLRGSAPRAGYKIGVVQVNASNTPGAGLFGPVTTFNPVGASSAAFATFLSGVDVMVVPWKYDLTTSGSAALNAFAPEVATFFNAGGDIWAQSAHDLATYYNFLPPGAAAGGTSIGGSTGFSATVAGVAIGITSNMINGFATHNNFTGYDSAFTVFETHSTDGVISIGIANATITGGGITGGEVPEPHTMALAGVAVALGRWRRRSSRSPA